jgi:hypothetical protein
VGHECIFMVASATGDSSNTTKIAAGDAIPEWRLVPNDNNIGQRNVYPISGGGTSGLTASFNQQPFRIKNPHLTAAGVQVRVTLPAFLQRLGWKIEFLNPGGAAFPLGPGESRDIVMKILPANDFTAADLPTGDRTIQVLGYAGGMLVGGMSYILDPNLKPPGSGSSDGNCQRIAESLLKCLDHCHDGKPEKVRRVRIRKINVDIELEEDCGD